MTTPLASCIIINKNERTVVETLDALEGEIAGIPQAVEVIVVDASGGKLDDVYSRYDRLRIVPFTPPAGVRVSIPHQRNRGIDQASSDIIVFIDAGCSPEPGWLARLLAPLAEGEDVVAGRTVAAGKGVNNYGARTTREHVGYLSECPTINLAFRKAAAACVEGFDESFQYGSDVDFSWRLVDRGYRIRFAPDAVVVTDWGDWRRQIRRSYVYGKARARLYRKHRGKRSEILRRDPVTVAYPLFLLGLPLALRWPGYVALLVLPMWRNRRIGGAAATLDHLVYGAGVLAEMTSWLRA